MAFPIWHLAVGIMRRGVSYSPKSYYFCLLRWLPAVGGATNKTYRMKNYILAIAIALVVGACSNSSNVISEKKMVSVLADIYLTDGTMDTYRYGMNKYQNIDSLYLYKTAFERNGVTREEFVASFQYYARSPKVMDNIYTQVVNKLSALQQETMAISEKEHKKKQGAKHPNKKDLDASKKQLTQPQQ